MGLVLCGLATLVAIPVLWFGSGSSIAVDASNASSALAVDGSGSGGQSDVTPSTASAGSLLDEVDGTGLFEGGADASSIDEHQDDGIRDDANRDDETVAVTSSSVGTAPLAWTGPMPSRSTAGDLASPTTRSGAEAAARAQESSTPAVSAASTSDSEPTDRSSGTPSTGAPTTAAPTTAAPTTAAPTTAAPTTAAPTTAAPTTAAPTTVATADDDAAVPTAAQWEALRQCESFGNYSIISGNGLYHGAYQFGQATWNSTARSAGRTDLVDLPPSQAAPHEQDALALHLWTLRGWAPWPHCGREVG